MFDAGKSVNLTGHTHQIQQAFLDVVHQGDHALDHLARQVLVVLGHDDIIQLTADLSGRVFGLFQKVAHALVQIAKLAGSHFAALQTVPVSPQCSGLLPQVSYDRRTGINQVHGPIGGLVGQGHDVVEPVGRIGDAGGFSLVTEGLGGVDLEVDNGVVQRAGQLTDFMVEPAITCHVDSMNDQDGFAKLALFQEVDQLPRVVFQGMFEFLSGCLACVLT